MHKTLQIQVMALLVTATALTFVGGCVSNIDSNAPESIRSFVEPDRGSDYQLYRPSSYDRNYDWPLVVVCHTALADSPHQQIRDWAQLAEREGLLVVAPTLSAVRKSFARKPKAQRELLRDDEARILSVVRHVSAGHSVSQDRVFLYGFSGGAHTALFSGLRNPGLFRAIALMAPAFDEAYLSAGEVIVESYQPVFVNYSATDSITDKHGKRCVSWLQSQRATVRVDATGSAGRADTPGVVAFFEDVVRRTAWMNIQMLPLPDANPVGRQFELRASPEPKTFHWSFGDGDESSVSRPIHVYARPGSYRVEVHATFADRESDSRSIMLAVPQGTTTPVAAKAASETQAP